MNSRRHAVITHSANWMPRSAPTRVVAILLWFCCPLGLVLAETGTNTAGSSAYALLAAQQPAPHPHAHTHSKRATANDRSLDVQKLLRVVLLRDYNTRVVAVGTVLLGISCGMVGVYMLMRRRSLVGDVVSHSALPGIAIAFLVQEAIAEDSGKWLPGLMLGAAVAGLFGIGFTTLITRLTRIKEDAALAIVLSVFFGFGIALFTIIQKLGKSSAGLNHFLLGQTASLVASDVWWIGITSLFVVALGILFFKELTLLCFDSPFAASQGWPVLALDLILMGLVVLVTVLGLQSVGVLLIVAMLVVPAAAARFWSDQLRRLMIVAMAIGGFSSLLGVLLSALQPKLATAPVIVLTSSALFLVSLLVGKKRGILVRWYGQATMRNRVAREHLLRAIYEILEANKPSHDEADWKRKVPIESLRDYRPWTMNELLRAIDQADRAECVAQVGGGIRLTERGLVAAQKLVRDHRMWELFLIHFADIAPTHVDRDADQIEHFLEPEMMRELERLLMETYPGQIPQSPHHLETIPLKDP